MLFVEEIVQNQSADYERDRETNRAVETGRQERIDAGCTTGSASSFMQPIVQFNSEIRPSE